MRRRYYPIGEFASRASVTTRTLRYYDRIGLLRPTRLTEAGYRLYCDDDLAELQQILALKFLGFSLEEIRAFKRSDPDELAQALAEQKEMLLDRRAQVDEAIAAIERAHELLVAGEFDWDVLARTLEAMAVEKKKEWMEKYFTPEARERLKAMQERSYSEEARRSLAERPQWTEEDQRRVDARYARIAEDLARLVADGADPADPRAQTVAAAHAELIAQFTQGDPAVEEGLGNFWRQYSEMPSAERPPVLPWGDEEGEFLRKALEIYHRRE